MMALEREEAANDDDETEGDEDEEAIDTGPDPEEAAKRFSSIAKGSSPVPERARQAGLERSQDLENPQEDLRRAHGIEARRRCSIN